MSGLREIEFRQGQGGILVPDHIAMQQEIAIDKQSFPPPGIALDLQYLHAVDMQLTTDPSPLQLGSTVADVWERIEELPENHGELAKHSEETAWVAQQLTKIYYRKQLPYAERAEVRHIVNEVGLYGALHDLGLTDPALIPLANQKKKFTDAERAFARTHGEKGAALLKGMNFPDGARAVAGYHHEAFSPDAPFEVRVISFADAYAAMRDERRTYQKTLNNWEAFSLIRNMLTQPGERYDADLMDAFEEFCTNMEIFESTFGKRTIQDIARDTTASQREQVA